MAFSWKKAKRRQVKKLSQHIDIADKAGNTTEVRKLKERKEKLKNV